MGIRINKCVGFGLECDVVKYIPKGSLGGKFLLNSEIMTENKDKIEEMFQSEGFKELVSEINGAKDVDLLREELMIPSFIQIRVRVVDDVDGNNSGIIFAMEDRWYRRDDTIDYYDSPSDIHEFRRLWSSGIYPFQRQMICNHDCLSGEKDKLMQGGTYNQWTGHWAKECKPRAKDELLASYLNDWRIQITKELLLAVYMCNEIENKIELMKALRPCLATWWS